MDLFVSQKAHAFGRQEQTPQNSGGRPVKDDRRGGHRSAQSPSPRAGLKESSGCGRVGGSRAGRPARSLTGRGGGTPNPNRLRPPQASASGRTAVAPVGRKGRSRSSQRTERSEAWSHAVARMARCPKSIEVHAALGDSTALVQQRTCVRTAAGVILLTIQEASYRYIDERIRTRFILAVVCIWPTSPSANEHPELCRFVEWHNARPFV